ncbi:MAG: hypothetical protein R6U50_01095 [Desulfobacterales bacterium]
MEKKTSNSAVFFVSTGRCGTQFLADKLEASYSDKALVRHEPFQARYRPRYYYSKYKKKESANLSVDLKAHLSDIAGILTHRHYIETGWPVYGVLPFFLSHFTGRIKVVHLHRHPIHTAASLTTHNVYNRGDWSEEMSISPFDCGVVQSDISGRMWHRMTDFEKCLFWWTEINQLAFDLREDFPSVPWLSIRFETLFSKADRSEMKKLLDFLLLPPRQDFFDMMIDKTDNWPLKTKKELNPGSISKYKITLHVMNRFGYDFDKHMEKEIRARYSTAKTLPIRCVRPFSLFSGFIDLIRRTLKKRNR